MSLKTPSGDESATKTTYGSKFSEKSAYKNDYEASSEESEAPNSYVDEGITALAISVLPPKKLKRKKRNTSWLPQLPPAVISMRKLNNVSPRKKIIKGKSLGISKAEVYVEALNLI